MKYPKTHEIYTYVNAGPENDGPNRKVHIDGLQTLHIKTFKSSNMSAGVIDDEKVFQHLKELVPNFAPD